MKRCKEPGCKKATRRKTATLCHKHEKQRWRKANPEKATYCALRDNAKRRGKVFTITFEQFLEFGSQTGYMDHKGRAAQDMSIDRINSKLGYEPGNLQPLTVSENIIKRWESKDYGEDF